MATNQNHIINKVVVEVNANSKKTADVFKNSAEQFLQEEVFPEIENYLASFLEISREEDQQISKIMLNVNLSGKNIMLDIKSTREAIKTQIVEKLNAVIQQPEIHEVSIVSKSKIASKADSFFYFLQKGTNAWWAQTNEEQAFSKALLFEITEITNFETRFLRVLQNTEQKTRLINQFFNEELQILFLGTRNKSKGFVEVLNSITKVNFSSKNKVKKELWSLFSEAFLHQQPKQFITNIEEKLYNHSTKIAPEKEEDFLKILTNFYVDKTAFSEKNLSESKFRNEVFSSVLNVDKNSGPKNKIADKENVILKRENDKIILSDAIKHKEVVFEEIKSSHISKESGVISEEKKKASDKSKLENESLKLKSDVKAISSTKTSEELIVLKQEKEKFQQEELKEQVGKTAVEKNQLKRTFEEPLTLKETEGLKENATLKANEIASINKEDVLKNKSAKNDVVATIEKESTYSKEPAINKPIACLVSNAGLILLHPFLKQLFKSCGFLNDKNQLLKQEEAVHTLHYLATKREQQLESNLVFEKFLCNVSIHQSIARDIVLSDAVKQKAEELLQSVTQNWGILKNVSTDLIRYEFLQRLGRLDLTKDNPQITVERKTQDILLDKLPWNYSLCKLPWMNNLIFTDW